MVGPDEGSEVGVEGGKGLSAGPFVLHDAEKVHHLVAQCRQVRGGGRGDLAGDAAQTFLDELFQRPSGAVAGEHGKIVKVDVRVPVGVGDLVVVDFRKPVVGGDGAGVGEDEAAHGVGDGGVFLDPPVVDLHIVIHGLLEVEDGGGGVAEFGPLTAVEDVGLGHIAVSGLHEDRFHAVLDIFDGHQTFLDLGLEIRRDLQRQKVDDGLIVLLFLRLERHADGIGNFGKIEIHILTVAFLDLIHRLAPFPFLCFSSSMQFSVFYVHRRRHASVSSGMNRLHFSVSHSGDSTLL